MLREKYFFVQDVDLLQNQQ